jgi:hypothetical protein
MTSPFDPNKTSLDDAAALGGITPVRGGPAALRGSNPVRGGPAAPEGVKTQEVDALLAQANLLRIRGKVPAAIDCCMAVMRICPGNVSAQGLLGDIYEAQGNIDEAVLWFRMALDANPNSATDKQKLGRLLAMRGQSLDAGRDIMGKVYSEGRSWGSPPSKPNPAPSLKGREYKARWGSRDRTSFFMPPLGPSKVTIRGLSVAAVMIGLALLVLVLTAVVQSHAQLSVKRPDPSPNPVVPTPIPGPVDTFALLPRDQYEILLIKPLRAATDELLPSLKFADVMTDERTGSLTLTFVARTDDPIDHDSVLRECLRAAQLCSQVTEAKAYMHITIRLLLSPDDLSLAANEGSLIFIGDISRADLDNYDEDPSLMTSSQAQLAFTNQWWAQDFTN